MLYAIKAIFVAVLATVTLMGGQLHAEAESSKELSVDALKRKLQKSIPQLPIDKLEAGPIKGLYQVVSQGEIYYLTADGMHLYVGGQLLRLDKGFTNLTQEGLAKLENEKSPFRAESIKNLKKTDFVTFEAKQPEKHKITVFTDVDCGYCRKLHRDVPELNKMGITVQYLAYPRAGANSESYNKLVGVWCSDDQKKAMDKAKLEGVFENKTCENTIQSKQMPLVGPFGIRGTPAIVTESGQLMPGYLPPQRLMVELEKAKKAGK